jgi:uncharacterized UPF0146 family protein
VATLQELIDVNKKVADAVLDQSAHLAKLLPIFDQLRKDVYDILRDRETERARIDLQLTDINSRLGVIKVNAEEIAGDIEEVHKDITNPRIALYNPEELEERRKPALVRVIEALERTSMKTKVLLLIGIIVVAASGWLHTLIGKLLGGD